MNPRQRRKKILVLAALLASLLLIAAGVWYFLARGQLPIPQVPPDKGINPPQYLYSIPGEGSNSLLKPLGVTISDQNIVYVADSGHSRVEAFTSGGRYLFTFGKVVGDAMLLPVSLAIGPKGQVYVVDRGRKKIYVFTSEGKYVRTLPGPRPSRRAAFGWAPASLVFDARGDYFVTDTLLKHQVLAYSPEDKLRFKFGRQGGAPNSKSRKTAGWFWFPVSVTLDNRGGIWVADSVNRRLQVYSRTGKFASIISTGGLPRGIKFYDRGMLLVVDTLGHDVGIWDKKGNNLVYFGERGTDIAQFRYPQDVSVGPDKKIYVADTYNDRVQVWGFSPQVPRGVAKYLPPPWCCLIPLLLLPLLLLLRKKRYLATDDFLELIVENERLDLLENKRIIVMDETYERFAHVEQDDIQMSDVMETQDYDDEDTRQYMDQYAVNEYQGRILSMTYRKKYLLTEDPDLRRIATALGVEVLDYEEFVARFEEQEEEG